MLQRNGSSSAHITAASDSLPLPPVFAGLGIPHAPGSQKPALRAAPPLPSSGPSAWSFSPSTLPPAVSARSVSWSEVARPALSQLCLRVPTSLCAPALNMQMSLQQFHKVTTNFSVGRTHTASRLQPVPSEARNRPPPGTLTARQHLFSSPFLLSHRVHCTCSPGRCL